MHPSLGVLIQQLFFFLLATQIVTDGLGWGLPIVEAMSMELPVITTNWSGPTEYLTEENSFPLAIEPGTKPAHPCPTIFCFCRTYSSFSQNPKVFPFLLLLISFPTSSFLPVRHASSPSGSCFGSNFLFLDLIPISFGSMGVEPSDIRGHKWADPSIKHLKTLMRYVVDHPDEAEKVIFHPTPSIPPCALWVLLSTFLGLFVTDQMSIFLPSTRPSPWSPKFVSMGFCLLLHQSRAPTPAPPCPSQTCSSSPSC